MQQEKKYITIPEFAEKVGMSRTQIFRKVKAGLIPAERFGKTYLIPIEELFRVTGEISEKDKNLITKGVEKTLKDYGSVIKDLGDE